MGQKKMTIYFLKVISTVLFCCQPVPALNVSLAVVGQMDDGQTLACGTNITIVCSVIPVTSSMNYLIDNTIVVTCVFGACASQSSKPANAIFEYSSKEGVYNLTIIQVSENDGGKEYKCHFGSDMKFVKPLVQVFPDESFSVITNSSDSNGINVTASTCVSASDKVSFTWYIFKTGEARKSYDTSPPTRKNVSPCQSTTNCNGEMSTSTITFNDEKDKSAELFFFQVEIIYTYSTASEPYILTIDSSTPYRLSENPVVTDGKSTCKKSLWIIYVVFHVLYAVQILICKCHFTKDTDTQKLDQYSPWRSICIRLMQSFPVVGLLFFIYHLIKTEKAKRTMVVPSAKQFARTGKNVEGVNKDCLGHSRVKKILITIVTIVVGPGLAMICYWSNFIDSKTLKVGKVHHFDKTPVEQDNNLKKRSNGTCNYCRVLVYVLGALILCFEWICLIVIIVKKCDLDDSTLLKFALIFLILICWIVFTVLHCFRCNESDKSTADRRRGRYPNDFSFGLDKSNDVGTGYESPRFSKIKSDISGGQSSDRFTYQNTEFCCKECRNNHKGNHSAHAYCITCQAYLCTKCLHAQHNNCIVLSNTVFIAGGEKLCCKESVLNISKLVGVCINCHLYLCSSCLLKHNLKHTFTGHEQHGFPNVLHQTGDNVNLSKIIDDADISCKYCKGDKIVECLHLHSGSLLCACCFEKVDRPKKKEFSNKTKTFISKKRNSQKTCQIHKVLGSEELPLEVYCLICRLYMCRGCFKEHRRICEHWSKTVEGNLFYCKFCVANKMNPVEYYDYVSGAFKCSKCISNCDKRSEETRSDYRKANKLMSPLFSSPPHCRNHEGVNSTVFCLHSEGFLCKDCVSSTN